MTTQTLHFEQQAHPDVYTSATATTATTTGYHHSMPSNVHQCMPLGATPEVCLNLVSMWLIFFPNHSLGNRNNRSLTCLYPS